MTSFIRSIGEDNQKDVAAHEQGSYLSRNSQLQSIKRMKSVIRRVGEDKRKDVIVLQQSTLLVYKCPVSTVLKGMTSFIQSW